MIYTLCLILPATQFRYIKQNNSNFLCSASEYKCPVSPHAWLLGIKTTQRVLEVLKPRMMPRRERTWS